MRILGFIALLAAAGLVSIYALTQTAEASDDQQPDGARPTASSQSTPSPRPTAEKVPQIEIVGDSYVSGSAEGGRGEAGWTRIIGSRFHDKARPVELNVMAEPGAGYLTRGASGRVFGETAELGLRPTADVVVLFGSRNDGRQTDRAMYGAAKSLYSAIHEKAPQAQIVVFGPVWVGGKVPDFIAANNAAMARAAAEEGVQYIDTNAEGWFSGAAADLIGADGIHPTDEGHAYLAAKIFPVLDKLVREKASLN